MEDAQLLLALPGDVEEFNADEYEEIYRINGPNMSYVGRCTIVGPNGPRGRDVRFVEHITGALQGKVRNCSRLLVDAMRVLGVEAFNVQHIELIHTNRAAEREIFWINTLGTQHPLGYNLTGGTEGRYELNDETKALMSISHRSYGKDARANYKGTINRIQAPLCVGYRAFHNGVPKGFFSSQFSEEDKRAMAIQWHLFGECDYELRLPRARTNVDPGGETLPTGVKFNPAKVHNPYRAYHPQRQHELKSPYFPTVQAAKAYVDLLRSFSSSDTPDEYLAVKRDKNDEKDPFLIYVKPKRSTVDGLDRQVIGYEVPLPASVTITGEPIRDSFMDTSNAVDQNLANALEFRRKFMKKEFMPIPEPDWVADLPHPYDGPDMSFIWKKNVNGKIGYEVRIPPASTRSQTEFYVACLHGSLSPEQNLSSAIAFRSREIKEGVIKGHVPAAQIHPVYTQEKHGFMTALKQSGTQTIVGWEVCIPEKRAKDGMKHRERFKKRSLTENLKDARLYRQTFCKADLLPDD